MTWRSAALVLLAVAACTACRAEASRAEAVAHADRYFEAMQAGRIDEALSMYAAEFYERTTRPKWQAKLAEVRRQLGDLESYHLETWNIEMLPNGTFTTLAYDVTYSLHPARETITVVVPVKGGAPGIFGHRIDSAVFRAATEP